jgi:hypothetical protein
LSTTDNPHPDERWVIPQEPATEAPRVRETGRFTRRLKGVAPVVAALLVGGGVVVTLDHQSGAGARAGQSGGTAVFGGTRLGDSGISRDSGVSRDSRDSRESDDSDGPFAGDQPP